MSDITSETIVSVYKSRNILIEQLKERDYDVDKYSGFSINEVYLMIQNDQLDMLVQNSFGHKIFVKYNIKKQLSTTSILNNVDDLFKLENILDKETDHLLYIVKDEPNDTLCKLMNELWNREKIYVSLYNIARLQFNILNHKMVPKHSILNNEEQDELISKYGLKNPEKQLPEISRFDPVAIAIGLRPGKICKIIRNSKTALESVFYRYCVSK